MAPNEIPYCSTIRTEQVSGRGCSSIAGSSHSSRREDQTTHCPSADAVWSSRSGDCMNLYAESASDDFCMQLKRDACVSPVYCERNSFNKLQQLGILNLDESRAAEARLLTDLARSSRRAKTKLFPPRGDPLSISYRR